MGERGGEGEGLQHEQESGRDWFCAPRDVMAPEKNETQSERIGMARHVRTHTGEQGESIEPLGPNTNMNHSVAEHIEVESATMPSETQCKELQGRAFPVRSPD